MRHPPIKTLEDLMERAEFDTNGGCWLWRGEIGGGYGYVSRSPGQRRERVTRLALELVGRPVPQGMYACHHCDVPSCFRPDHLFVGTPQQNTDDCISKGRRKSTAGEANPHSVLTESVVLAMRKSSESTRVWADRLGCSFFGVWKARRGNTWGHLPLNGGDHV